MNSLLQNYPFLIVAGLCVVLIFWNVFQQVSLSKTKRGQKKLFSGKKSADLEEIILENKKKITENQKEIETLYRVSSQVHLLAKKGIHQIGMVRFNPFRDIGGDQSFSIALLDGQKNGLTISSIYSREGVRVYSKLIRNAKAVKHQLTEEEKRAIEIALTKKSWA